MPSPARILLGHMRTFISAAIGIASSYLLPLLWSLRTRLIGAWDIGAAAFLLLCVSFFVGATASFAIIVGEFGGMKDAAPRPRS